MPEPRDVDSGALRVELPDLGGEALHAERRDLGCLSSLFKDLKELGTESLLQYGYVATLSVLLFVSCSGLGLAFFGLWWFCFADC